jgi:DNA repair protein RecO (recombination protein O)
MQVKDRVFILKKQRYGDADLIIHALNPKGERLNLFARSALRSKKRFGGGVLEPTHYVNVMYEEKSGRSDQPLHTLKEASLIEDFVGLRTDYNRLETALYLIQLVHDVSREGDVHANEIFNLLGNALRAAEKTSAPHKLRTHFEIKLLAHHGVLDVGQEEAKLLKANIADHETAELSDDEWRLLASRLQFVLRDFLATVRF